MLCLNESMCGSLKRFEITAHELTNEIKKCHVIYFGNDVNSEESSGVECQILCV